MMGYNDYISTEDPTVDPLESHLEGDLNEGVLRGLSALGLVNKLHKISVDVMKAKTTDKKLDLIASQNSYLGLLVFSKK